MSWLTRHLTRLRDWFTQPGPRRWRGVALVMPFVVVMGLAIGYTSYVQRESDQRWCELIVLLSDSAQATTPTTPEELLFIRIIEQLREDFHC